MDEVTVRIGTVADADVAGRLLHDFNTEFESPTPSAAEFADRFRTILTRDDVVLIIAMGEGEGGGSEPVGFALVTMRPTPYHDGPLLQLEELYVRPRLRDGGIGTLIMTRLLELAAEHSAGEIHINVDEVDTDTRRFYERHGFTNIAPGEDYRMLCYIREV
ncbi:GNAT family N-acetyltransferase [Nostocoides sp. F2B08]|uniref:GNAT family N-acetyltransferase n=1 Tax=Nostocoides sp. F2B08 TaxID=2653936 RepID=UPI001262BC88|nr:GNAT family N-acetyltransferase [Tetrasphaera sp. F2B08]KAB7745150.1 GNAT family N-acetyltransferase [Tetrasphaera sp. F2B08]